jgi:hypothetical protein
MGRGNGRVVREVMRHTQPAAPPLSPQWSEPHRVIIGTSGVHLRIKEEEGDLHISLQEPSRGWQRTFHVNGNFNPQLNIVRQIADLTGENPIRVVETLSAHLPLHS